MAASNREVWAHCSGLHAFLWVKRREKHTTTDRAMMLSELTLCIYVFFPAPAFFTQKLLTLHSCYAFATQPTMPGERKRRDAIAKTPTKKKQHILRRRSFRVQKITTCAVAPHAPQTRKPASRTPYKNKIQRKQMQWVRVGESRSTTSISDGFLCKYIYTFFFSSDPILE